MSCQSRWTFCVAVSELLDDFLVVHDFLVEVDLCDGRMTSSSFGSHCLLDICIGHQMLRDWLTAAFFCAVFLLVIRLILRFVSVVALWFALSAVGSALVLPAVGYALLPAVGYALLPAVGYVLVGSLHNYSPSQR